MPVPPVWRESDLLAMVTSGEKESLILEYKACDSLGMSDGKKNELSKDVSAFANSAGGTIIYGVVENGHVPIGLDVGFDRSEFTKEWLEQVINSRIQRRVDGIVINEVELTTTAPGRVAFVVTIPQSDRAPHQAHDKRFYKRFNFESVPMEEYEVRDTSRRGQVPDLSVSFAARVAGSTMSQEGGEPLLSVAINATIINESPTPSEYCVIKVFVEKGLAISGVPSEFRRIGDHQLTLGGTTIDCDCLHMNHGIPGRLPIFQGVNFSLFDQPITVSPPKPGNYLLGWEVIAPGMGNRLRTALLCWDGAMPRIVVQ
jgi:hypothetical protein